MNAERALYTQHSKLETFGLQHAQSGDCSFPCCVCDALCWIARMKYLIACLWIHLRNGDRRQHHVTRRHDSKQRQCIRKVVMFGFLCSMATMFWTFLRVQSGVETPVLASVSGGGGKPPNRGDVMWLSAYPPSKALGELVAYRLHDIVIVHRVVQVTEEGILTKGDDNRVNDVGLYPTGESFLNHRKVIGQVGGIVPSIGWIVIWAQEYPLVFYLSLLLEALAWMLLPHSETSRSSHMWTVALVMLGTWSGMSVG